MVTSAKQTAVGEIEVCAWLDDDDSDAGRYRPDEIVRYGSGPRPYIAGSLCTSGLWSKAWEMATGDIAMLGADDVVFRTPGWDAKVQAAFAEVPDRIVMVYGDDRTKRKAPVTPFVHRRWIDAAGFTPQDFQGWYGDQWIWQMAAELGRVRFLPDLKIPHFQRSRSDATYRDGAAAREAVGGWQGMRDRFYSSEMVARREAQIARLRAAMDGTRVDWPDPVPAWLAESLVLGAVAH